MISSPVAWHDERAIDLDFLSGVLDGLEGTVYATDTRGRLLSVGKEMWLAFATKNGAPTLGEAPPNRRLPLWRGRR